MTETLATFLRALRSSAYLLALVVAGCGSSNAPTETITVSSLYDIAPLVGRHSMIGVGSHSLPWIYGPNGTVAEGWLVVNVDGSATVADVYEFKGASGLIRDTSRSNVVLLRRGNDLVLKNTAGLLYPGSLTSSEILLGYSARGESGVTEDTPHRFAR